MTAAPLPGPARSAEAISLAWTDCRASSGGEIDQSFACDDNATWLELIVAFESPADLGATAIGIEAVVDVQHESGTMPDWWYMGSAGCRAGRLLASGDFSSYSDCTDPWGGMGAGELQGFDIGEPRGQPNQLRIKAVAGLLSPVTIQSGVVYYAVRLRIGTALSTGANACPGCLPGACVVLNGITIRRSGAPDVLLVQPAPGNGNWVTWRSGGAADCQLVPARARTWGSIKSLYR